jgi:2-polyprenyl-3-methyl-5-hydroxy-6-metoxy-1,4-benzoquinol methylase
LRTLPSTRRNTPQAALRRAFTRLGAHLSNGLSLGINHGFDSGILNDYVYHNEAQGNSVAGRLFDRIYLNQTWNKALRSRTHLLQKHILNVVLERRKRGMQTNIVDMGSGVGRYNLELLHVLEGNDVSVACLDNHEETLKRGQLLTSRYGLSDRVTFHHQDVTDPAWFTTATAKPDIIIVSGLFETIPDDAVVCRILLGIYSMLAPGGLLICTNLTRHPSEKEETVTHAYPVGVSDDMGSRPVARLERWAREAGFQNVQSDMEPYGVYSITRCFAS